MEDLPNIHYAFTSPSDPKDKKLIERRKSIDSCADPSSVSSLIGSGWFQYMLIGFISLLISPYQAFNHATQFLILLEPEYTCAHEESYSGVLTPDQNPLNLFIKIGRVCTFSNGTSCYDRGFKYEYDFIYPTIVSMVRSHLLKFFLGTS